MLDEIEQQFWTNLLQTIWESWMLSGKSWAGVLAHHRVENIRGGEFDSWFWVILEASEGEEVSEVRFYIIEEWIYSTVFSTVVGAYAGFHYSRFSFLDMVRNRSGVGGRQGETVPQPSHRRGHGQGGVDGCQEAAEDVTT